MARINDLYERITQGIIDDLAGDVLPWHKPWVGTDPDHPVSLPLRHNAVPYQGINVLILWVAAIERGYSSPYWMTYRQAKAEGGQVRKGERAAHIVFATTTRRTEADDAGNEEETVIPFRRVYSVFNANQIDNLPDTYSPPVPDRNAGERLAAAERWFASVGADVRFGGDRAFFSPATDRIQMPLFQTFDDPAAYYSTLGHEHVHWTGAKARLARDMSRADDENIAREELVAELGSAFLCADLGISLTPRADHTAYIASWLTLLASDNRAVFTAATHAQKAVAHLHSLAGTARDTMTEAA